MKRSGDELNFNEGEQGAKSRKTLNFTRADRDASSSSSIGDVAGPETAKDKCTKYWKFSWWDTRSYSFESPDETATPGRVLVLYSFEKTQLRQGDRTIPACSTCCQYIMLMTLGVHHVKYSVRKYDYTYQVGQTSRIGEWRYCRSCEEPSLL